MDWFVISNIFELFSWFVPLGLRFFYLVTQKPSFTTIFIKFYCCKNRMKLYRCTILKARRIYSISNKFAKNILNNPFQAISPIISLPLYIYIYSCPIIVYIVLLQNLDITLHCRCRLFCIYKTFGITKLQDRYAELYTYYRK